MKSGHLSPQTAEPGSVPLTEVRGGHSQYRSEIESNLARRMAAFDELIQRTSHAHGMGVIHRDIKPDNVFIHRGESVAIVKVLDFGVSKLIGETPLHVRNLVSVEGCGPGTPIYMAPERLAGGAYDGKSDVFSLGIILYQMVGGKLPRLRHRSALLDPANEAEDPAVTALANLQCNIPDELKRLIAQLLAPEAVRRPSAAELAADLERLCRDFTMSHKDHLDADFRPSASYLDVHSATEEDNQATILA